MLKIPVGALRRFHRKWRKRLNWLVAGWCVLSPMTFGSTDVPLGLVHAAITIALIAALTSLHRGTRVKARGAHARSRSSAAGIEIVEPNAEEGRVVQVIAEIAGGQISGDSKSPLEESALPTVTLNTADGLDWKVTMRSIRAGLDLLALAGVGPSHRRLSLQRLLHWGQGVVMMLGLAVGLTFTHLVGTLNPAQSMWIEMLFMFAPLLLLHRADLTKLVVGTDGSRWWNGLQRKFLRHRDVRKIRQEHNTLVLVTDTDEVCIRFDKLKPRQIELVREWINLVAAAEQSDAELFGRAGRDTDAWLKDVRTVFTNAYRRASVPKVRVVEALNDATAGADERLGAAIALFEEDPVLAQEIIANIATTSADPELLAALELLDEESLPQAAARIG